LNAAFGCDESLNFINTSPEFYSKTNIEFLGIEAIDLTSFDLFSHFEVSANFIEKALVQKGLRFELKELSIYINKSFITYSKKI
jgi:hypothetical protein